MDINRLELLCDIAETRNLTLSAERLNYTQSGVSHAINKIEAEMGVNIFRRTNRGVELTRDGEMLMPYIRVVVSHGARMKDVIDSIQGLQRGSICVGTYSSIASHWLPSVINRFQNMYPNINMRLKEGGLEEIEQWMNNGTVDFCFVSWRRGQNFKFISLAKDPLYAVTSKRFVLPEEYGGVFPISAFGDYPFIASESGVDADVELALQTAALQPPVSFTCRDDHTIISMVANGLGVSMLPALFIQGAEDRIDKYPVDPCTMRTLGIGAPPDKSMSVASRAFVDLARDMIGSMEHDMPEICSNKA